MTTQHLSASIVFASEVRGEEFAIGNMLAWSTATEKGSNYFLIEKSENGQSFEVIGNVPATGFSNAIKEYQFLDMAASGDASYRLKLVDKSGVYTYSRVALVRRSIPNLFSIVSMSHLEITQSLNIQVDVLKKSNLNYLVRAANNTIVNQGKLENQQQGLIDISISFSDLPQGTYKIVIYDDKNEEAEELVVRRVANELEKKAKNAVTTRNK